MTQSILLATIRDSRWFSAVPAEAHQWLAARARVRAYSAGQIICFRGQPLSHVYGVVRGLIRTYITTAKGEEHTFQERTSGQWFPHHVPDSRPVYLGNCVCEQDSDLVVVSQPVIAQFGDRWPEFFRGLYFEMSNSISISIGRVELLSSHDLRTRLAVLLIRLLRDFGKEDRDGVRRIAVHFTQSLLASRVGATRQRVNRILNAWVRDGLIQLERSEIHVLDTDGLRREAERSGFSLARYFGDLS